MKGTLFEAASFHLCSNTGHTTSAGNDGMVDFNPQVRMKEYILSAVRYLTFLNILYTNIMPVSDFYFAVWLANRTGFKRRKF